MLDTPVAFFIFRRPHTTRRVFERIREQRPKQLYIVADGPRTEQEAVLCAETRGIVEQIDWDCEVSRLYADQNLGLRDRVSSGLNWVFEHCERAIILEDDCLPDPTFFRFCEELLEHHAHNERVRHISGNNFFPEPSSAYSYHVSRYPFIWGWATWRRSWQYYDVQLNAWNSKSTQRRFLQCFDNVAERRFWKSTLDAVKSNRINTWDYQWTFSLINWNGISITPTVNLVENIGVGQDATNTVTANEILLKKSALMTFPLHHPIQLEINKSSDNQVAQLVFRLPSLRTRIQNKLLSVHRLLTKLLHVRG